MFFIHNPEDIYNAGIEDVARMIETHFAVTNEDLDLAIVIREMKDLD